MLRECTDNLKSGVAESDNTYMAFQQIPLDILQVNRELEFDLCIKVNDEMRLFAGKNKVFTEAHYNRLFEAGLNPIYARIQTDEDMQDFISKYLIKIIDNPDISPLIKAVTIYSSLISGMKKIYEDPDPGLIGEIKQNIYKIAHVLRDEVVGREILQIIAHDKYPYTHAVNVCIYATLLANKLPSVAENEKYIQELSFGFLVHDIGMKKIPPEILNKQGKLTEEEWELIKKHPKWGYDILSESGHITDDALIILFEHHERHDGSGYPLGIKDDRIHTSAKICTFADAFDALTSNRSYRLAKNPFEALTIMQKEMAHEFDLDFFKLFLLLLIAED